MRVLRRRMPALESQARFDPQVNATASALHNAQHALHEQPDKPTPPQAHSMH
jgi:hypothetical protein